MVDESDIKALISNVLNGESSKHCRLCLKETGEAFCTLDDEIQIDPEYGIGSKNVAEVLTSVCGCTDTSDWSPLVAVCAPCASSALNCFLFIEMCRNSAKKLHFIYNTLADSLGSNTSLPQAKSMYVVLDDTGTKVVLDQKDGVQNAKVACKRVKKLLRSQSDTNSKRKGYQCVECGRMFPSVLSLRRHIARHVKRFTCDKCGKAFSAKSRLKWHVDQLHADKIYPCSQCPQRYGSEAIVKRHQLDSHNACSCPACGKDFTNRQTMRQHLLRHVMKTCEICGKNYKCKNSFIKHRELCVQGLRNQRRPQYNKQYSCSECQKSFTHKASLQGHVKLEHGDGKAYICDWCGKKFSAPSRLEAHIVKHTRERNYKCEMCAGAFVSKAALLYHTRRHTGERPYPCDLCNEKFLSASRRMDHIRRKHLGPSFHCTYCDRKFTTHFSLKKHLQRHLNPLSKLYESVQ